MSCVWYRQCDCETTPKVNVCGTGKCPVCGTGATQCVWYRRAIFGRLRHQSSQFSVAGEKPAKVVTQTLVLNCSG